MIWRPHDLTRNSSSNLSPANPQHTISNIKVTAWSRIQLITQAMKYETSSKHIEHLCLHLTGQIGSHGHTSLQKGPGNGVLILHGNVPESKLKVHYRGKRRKWIQGSNLSHGIQGQNRLLDVTRVPSTFSSALLPSSYKIPLSVLLFTSRERDRERGRRTSGCFLNRGSTFPIQPRKCLLQLHWSQPTTTFWGRN